MSTSKPMASHGFGRKLLSWEVLISILVPLFIIIPDEPFQLPKVHFPSGLTMYALFAAVSILPMAVIAYVIYERMFHPLADFPGPFWASITDFWRFYHEIIGDTPHILLKYHQKYGPVLRVAPNELNFSSADVVDVVYKKGGRNYPKSEFYDGFTAIHPNVFGTRDENLHAVRRRQMAHGFSQASFTRMEYIFDKHAKSLTNVLAGYAKSGQICDLKSILHCYGHDVNCDLSLGLDIKTVEAKNPKKALPPLNEHIVLSKLTGYVPWIKPYLSRYGMSIPWPYLQLLLTSRAKLAQEAKSATETEIARTREGKDEPTITSEGLDDVEQGHENLLSALVQAKDSVTGESLPQDQISSNALAFLVAGSHTTAASLVYIFWHLTHNQEMMHRVASEVTEAYADLSVDIIPPYAGMESKLPYLSAIVKESFRLTPTVLHPLPRIAPLDSSNPRYPTVISDTMIPPGTAVSASIPGLHQNPEIWGHDAAKFVPERWFSEETRENEKYLMHFGAGHRMCLGKNQALIMLWKALVEILRRFELKLPSSADVDEKLVTVARGFAEAKNPLDVIVSER